MKRLRGASYQVCRSAGGRLRQRSRLDEQGDGDEGNDDQSATGDEHVTDIMSRGTCPHGCLIGLGHNRTFVLIHRTLLSHEPNRLTKRIGFPFQSRLKHRYLLPRDIAQTAPTVTKRPNDQTVPRRGGIIRVGGSTEVAVKEKKDRVDDAMHATKAAVEEGIVSGGGVALLRAKAAIGKLTDENEDVQSGINIVLRALEAPIRQIAENSGVEGSIVVGKILEDKSQTYGFDAQTEQYVDMLNAGIVDPAKVVRVALQDAASIAGLMITTEAMIAETPKKKEASALPGGGMGGMDY